MKHQTISFIKSFIRILGYCALTYEGYRFSFLAPWLFVGGIILILSELVGIVEEIGHD